MRHENNIASVYPLTKAGGFLGEATAVEPEPYIHCLKTMVFWFNIKEKLKNLTSNIILLKNRSGGACSIKRGLDYGRESKKQKADREGSDF